MTEELTRPERFAALNATRAFVRQVIAQGGACSLCTHRMNYFGVPRCTGNPARMYPLCDKDRQGPSFELDQATIEGKIHG